MIYGLKIVGAHSSVQPIPAPIWASLCLKLFYPAPRGAFRLLLRRLFTFFLPRNPSLRTDGSVYVDWEIYYFAQARSFLARRDRNTFARELEKFLARGQTGKAARGPFSSTWDRQEMVFTPVFTRCPTEVLTIGEKKAHFTSTFLCPI